MPNDQEITEICEFHDKVAQKERRREWVADARQRLRTFAGITKRPFLIEEARNWAERAGLAAPADSRAWGFVVREAAKAGEIVQCGSARAGSSNGSLKPLWLAAPVTVPDSPTVMQRLRLLFRSRTTSSD